jgi:hypothetical protein
MKTFMMGAAALAFVALGSTGASAANLIQNGDFTAGFNHWLVAFNNPSDGQKTVVIDYTTGANYPNGAFGEVVPQDPNTVSHDGAYFVTDVPKLNSITQFFDVTNTGAYTFSFDYYAPNNGQANPLNGFVTVLSGLQILDNINIKSVGDGWQNFTDTLTFNHTGIHDISFLFSVPGNYGKKDQYAADLIVTNVSLTGGVPEPATWGMMLLGFFGLGAMVRRRSATAAGAIA